jgi:hypothetical protein
MGRDDFTRTSRTNELEERSYQESDTWEVYSGYELEEDPDYGTREYDGLKLEHEYPPFRIKPKTGWDGDRGRARSRRYRPLEEVPHLFLDFARLYDKGFSVERILGWVHRHGTLDYSRYAHKHRDFRHANTVRAFWGEVCWAAGVLAMYEAALNQDESEAQRLAQNEFHFLAPPNYDAYDLWESTEILDRSEYESRARTSPLWKKFGGEAEEVADLVENYFGGDYLAYALEVAVVAVDEVVQEFCFPALRLDIYTNDIVWVQPDLGLRRNDYSSPSRIKAGWGFRNLLGAMYMQMRWLMAAGADLKRCEYCGRIISLAPPSPGARKPRTDKTTCNKLCQQNLWNRRNRRKPRRQGEGRES